MSITPTVAIGGTLCDERLWRDCFDTLAPLTIVAGKLPSGAVAQHDTMAPYASELLASLPPRFSLVGFSLGGLIALELAAQAPERIATLVLVCAGAGPETPEGAARRRQGETSATSLGMARHASEDLIPRYRLGSKEHAGTVAAMAESIGLPLYRRQNSLAISRADSRPRLHFMNFPAILVSGRNDPLCPPLRHEEMARDMPDIQRIVVENCGHMLPLERPEVIAKLAVSLTGNASGRN